MWLVHFPQVMVCIHVDITSLWTRLRWWTYSFPDVMDIFVGKLRYHRMFWHVDVMEDNCVSVCFSEEHFPHKEIITHHLLWVTVVRTWHGTLNHSSDLSGFVPAWGHVCIYGLHDLTRSSNKRCPMWSGQCRHRDGALVRLHGSMTSVRITKP